MLLFIVQISNQPPKGTTDWFPEEFAIRKYIFDTWRKVCLSFGYEEYLTPIMESADIYRAKSGEDIGGKELMVVEDRGGRELALRPEMTPSVTRMISRRYESLPKPIRYFSIANFWRNENVQRGRNREFWQLNFDLFGSKDLAADTEILQLALEIMLAFQPPAGSFVMYVNHRGLIDFVMDEIVKVDVSMRIEVVRVLDKWEKLEIADTVKRLASIGLDEAQVNKLGLFMSSMDAAELVANLPDCENSPAFQELKKIIGQLEEMGYADWIKFQPNVIRGFDYYDGMVFEVFDKHVDNSRAMFGGGRYNGLAGIFGGSDFPAVGCAPGDETTRLFLESWGLLSRLQNEAVSNRTYLPILAAELEPVARKLATKLRSAGETVLMGLEPQRLGKALEFANRINANKVIILGTDEVQQQMYLLKDMVTGSQIELPMASED